MSKFFTIANPVLQTATVVAAELQEWLGSASAGFFEDNDEDEEAIAEYSDALTVHMSVRSDGLALFVGGQVVWESSRDDVRELTVRDCREAFLSACRKSQALYDTLMTEVESEER